MRSAGLQRLQAIGVLQNAFPNRWASSQQCSRVFNRFAPGFRASLAGTNGRHQLHEFSGSTNIFALSPSAKYRFCLKFFLQMCEGRRALRSRSRKSQKADEEALIRAQNKKDRPAL
jgi:hypothetical protein